MTSLSDTTALTEAAERLGSLGLWSRRHGHHPQYYAVLRHRWRTHAEHPFPVPVSVEPLLFDGVALLAWDTARKVRPHPRAGKTNEES